MYVQNKTPLHTIAADAQDHAQRKQPLAAAALQSAIDIIRGAVMICYPQGLPEWDFVRQCLEEREDLTGTNVSRDGRHGIAGQSAVCTNTPGAGSIVLLAVGGLFGSGCQLLSLLVLADGVHSTAAWRLRSPCKHQWLQVSCDMATTLETHLRDNAAANRIR